MPTPGLSLLGFFERDRAIQYLREACVPVDTAEAALEAEWTAAKARIGPAYANGGKPDIQEIPVKHAPYIGSLAQNWPQVFAQGPQGIPPVWTALPYEGGWLT